MSLSTSGVRRWRGGFCRKPGEVLTGTKERMKSLPAISHVVNGEFGRTNGGGDENSDSQESEDECKGEVEGEGEVEVVGGGEAKGVETRDAEAPAPEIKIERTTKSSVCHDLTPMKNSQYQLRMSPPPLVTKGEHDMEKGKGGKQKGVQNMSKWREEKNNQKQMKSNNNIPGAGKDSQCESESESESGSDSSSFSCSGNDRFGPTGPNGTNKGKGSAVYDNEAELRGPTAKTRCVYNYEDKYRFARILSSDTLVFDSHFESGNLCQAERVSYGDARDKNSFVQEYDLQLHHDLHSLGHNQWFYFSCSNIAKNTRVKFNVVNLGKPDSLFNNGMRPLLFSQVDAATRGIGWQRTGESIFYYCNKTTAPSQKGREKGNRQYFTLTFTHTFLHSNDVCFFAMCYPYTYSDLQHYLYKLQLDDNRRKTFRRETLCRTLANNEMAMLTITNRSKDLRKIERRKGVVLTARVHPGESNASWIMHGIIDFLTSDDPIAYCLRQKFVFKVVPMLNPDGVINGNYRTSLAGVDLNRRWDKPDPVLHPTIHSVKEMVQKFQKTREVVLQTDIHGHSRKEGLFVYGCVPDKAWERYVAEKAERERQKKLDMEREAARRSRESGEEVGSGEAPKLAFGKALIERSSSYSNLSDTNSNGNGSRQNSRPSSRNSIDGVPQHQPPPLRQRRRQTVMGDDKFRVRIFPRIFDRKNDHFVFRGCNFKLSKSKASTMRIVMFEELGINCSYTLEASFSGLDGYHFNTQDLKNMGRDFCLSLRDFEDYLDLETATLTAAKTTDAGLKEGFAIHSDDEDGEDEADIGSSFVDVDKTSDVNGQNDSDAPINSIVQEEMKYWKRLDGDGEAVEGALVDNEESAGSDSDPSGDNLTESELKKRLARKVAKKKKGGGGKGARRSIATPTLSAAKKKTIVSSLAMPPRRPEGKKPSIGLNRRSFTEGEGNIMRSRTPRESASRNREEQSSAGARNRAQSAGSGVTRTTERITERKKFVSAHAPMYKMIDSGGAGSGDGSTSNGVEPRQMGLGMGLGMGMGAFEVSRVAGSVPKKRASK